MALLTETKDRLKDIQRTNHEILKELGKLEEKQQRRREKLLQARSQNTKEVPERKPVDRHEKSAENHVDAENRKPDPQPTEVTKPNDTSETPAGAAAPQSETSGPQFSLSTEMMNYLHLLKRKKAPIHQDNRLCERFDVKSFAGHEVQHRPVRAGPQKKIQHLDLPANPRSDSQRQTQTRAMVKAKPVTEPGPGMVPPNQLAQMMQLGALQQQVASGFTMAFNPLNGQMMAIDPADIPKLVEQAEAADQIFMALGFDPTNLTLKVVHGKEYLQEIVSVLNDENLDELDPAARNLMVANRKMMELFTENDTVPFAQYMQIFSEVLKVEGMADIVKMSTAATMKALMDPSQSHQVPIVGLDPETGRPALVAPPGQEPQPQDPRKSKQRALPPASGSQQSSKPSSSSSDSQKSKPSSSPSSGSSGSRGQGHHHQSRSKPASSKSHHTKTSATVAGTPNVRPQRPAGTQSTQQGGGQGTSHADGTGTSANSQQAAAGAYSRTGPALQLGIPGLSAETGPSAPPPRSTQAKPPPSPEEEGEPVYINESMWTEIANQQVEAGARARSIRERGMDTILCLDLSQSMKGEPWKQATAFIKGFIEGIQNTTLMDDVYEHVALVTFGSETKVQQHMTCDYVEVLRKLAKLTPGGPSPLWAGMTMVYAAMNGSGSVFVSNGYKIHPRVFLLTDGRPTPANMIAGPDTCAKHQVDMEKFKVAEVTATIHKEIPVTLNVVPLGDFDLPFLEQMAKLTGGKVVSPEDWDSHTRSFRNYLAACKVGPMLKTVNPGLVQLFLDSLGAGSTSTQDRLEMDEFLRTHKPASVEDTSSDSEEIADMPPLGSRVRRNLLMYPDHTTAKVGTVTRHMQSGHLGVTWDDPDEDDHEREKVRYSDSWKGVLPCDEPRRLKDELIAVGCRVKRGSDWHYGDQDGGAGKLGSVFSVDSQGIVKVRWDCGRSNTYRYGQDGIFFDVEIVEVQQKPEKSEKKDSSSSVDMIEEMNRRNKANSRNIMDSMPEGASNTTGQPQGASNTTGQPQGASNTTGQPQGASNTIPQSKNAAQTTEQSKNAANTIATAFGTRTSDRGNGNQGGTEGVVSGGREVGRGTGRVDSGVSGTGKGTRSDGQGGAVSQGVTGGARPKAVLAPEEIKWRWNNNGTWQAYPSDVCCRIETSFRRNPRGTSLVKIGEKQFRIVFARMEQVDIETRDKYPVSRE